MNCNNFQNQLIFYIENQLDENEQVAMEKHSETCTQCAGLLSQVQHLYSAIEAEKKVETSPFIFTRIMAQIEAETMGKVQQKVPVFQRMVKPALVAAILFVGLFIGILIGSIYHKNDAEKYPVEFSYMNDMTMESLDGLAAN